MSYRCVDLLSSIHMKDAQLLAGKNGLSNTIRWPYIAELSENLDMLEENLRTYDCLLILGNILKDNQDALLLIMEKAVKLKLSAVIIYKNQFLEAIPKDIINIANENDIPLIFFDNVKPPVSDIVCEMSYRSVQNNDNQIRGKYLLFDIMINDIRDCETFQGIARFYKYDLTIPHQAIFISYTNVLPTKNRNLYIHESSQESIIIENTCVSIISRYCPSVLMTSLLNSYLILLPKIQHISAFKIANMLLKDLRKNINQLNFTIGIGNMYENLSDFHQSIEEAKQIVYISSTLGNVNTVSEVKDVLIPMFFNSQSSNPFLAEIVKHNIEPLLEADRTGQFLFDTLCVYFKYDKNISVSADKLFVHRNTLSSRLRKIEQLTNKSLSNTYDCFELQFALHFYNISRKISNLP